MILSQLIGSAARLLPHYPSLMAPKGIFRLIVIVVVHRLASQDIDAPQSIFHPSFHQGNRSPN